MFFQLGHEDACAMAADDMARLLCMSESGVEGGAANLKGFTELVEGRKLFGGRVGLCEDAEIFKGFGDFALWFGWFGHVWFGGEFGGWRRKPWEEGF